MAGLAEAEGVRWYLSDHLGTVRDLADAAGEVIDHLAYDAFGNVLAESNPAAGDRFRFTGREFDAATGQYYYRARYYDGRIGRFTSEDPLGLSAGDVNLYRYVHNRPTMATDPYGLTADETPYGFIPSAGRFDDSPPQSLVPTIGGVADGGNPTGATESAYVENDQEPWNESPSKPSSPVARFTAGIGPGDRPLTASVGLARALVASLAVTVSMHAEWDHEFVAFELPSLKRVKQLPLRARLALYAAVSKLCRTLTWTGSYTLTVPRPLAAGVSHSQRFTLPVPIHPSLDARLPKEYFFIVYLKVTITVAVKVQP